MSLWICLVGLLLLTKDQVFAAPGDKPKAPSVPEPDPANFFNVTFDSSLFINKGLVGFGLIPSNFRESTGDTFGGVGSAIAIQRGSWKKNEDGTFSGTLIVQPDRGYNVIDTINYQARQHEVAFTLSPHYGTAPLSFNDSQKTLKLNYRSTLLYSEAKRIATTGLDPLAVRKEQFLGLDPEQPIVNSTFNHLTVDAEGLVLNRDGTFWVSDEYGPYVHLFSKQGERILSIQPPNAILPFHTDSKTSKAILNFTTTVDPNTGRVGNQGFEGLTTDPSGTKLFVLLQSATVQDGGESKSTSRFTRLFEYDILDILTLRIPILRGEYVVPLPQKPSNGNTFAQSEIHYITDTQFLILARDGDGNGNGPGNEKSSYKSVDMFDISKATNIAHTKYDDPANPIAVGGVLVNGIKPAVYQPFVNLLDATQLSRFGLHNGKPLDSTLINGKWESIALAPVGDSKFPNDHFLFVASDNDFLTTDGVAVGQPYNAGMDVDSQFLVYRVTLPTVRKGTVEESIGI